MMRSPLLWLSLLLVIALPLLWQVDRHALDKDREKLLATLSTRNRVVPTDRVVQVTLAGNGDCPVLTWYNNRWLSIQRGHENLESLPGHQIHNFRVWIAKLLADYPQCPQAYWVLYGRFTPQTREIVFTGETLAEPAHPQ